MEIIEGKGIAQEIKAEISEKIKTIKGRKPGLAFLLIGSDPASKIYVNLKYEGCKEVGIISKILHLPSTISEKELLREIETLNQLKEIDGILIQQPLPKHLSSQKINETVSPEKDVDGFHPINQGKLLLGENSGFVPCTPLGIAKLLEKIQIDLSGKHVVIIGRSNIVGKPLAALLVQNKQLLNATVTLAHSKTKNLSTLCKTADVLIAAAGQPDLIGKECVKKGSVIIDVGINRDANNRLVGDVNFNEVKNLCAAITPVPGGVGPMTIAMLLNNTLISYFRNIEKKS